MDNFTSSCNIPRKFTGIQEFGMIIVLDKNTLKIQGMSNNVPLNLNMTKNELYDLENFSKIVKSNFENIFYNFLLYKVDKKSTRVILLFNEKEYYCHTYKTNQFIVVELEEKQDNINISFEHVFDLHNDINFTHKTKVNIVNIIKDITKFKRVLFYEFNQDWSGIVTVEKSDYLNCSSFLDTHFYETDIPRYVRGLYCRNPIRYIYDINQESIEINWLNDSISDKVDASSSEIINVGPSHKEYLRLMDARTSFSLAILVNHKLWGLIICHNDTPLYISPSIRQQCFQFVNMISNNIMNSINSIESNFNSYIHELYRFTSIFNFTSVKETENLLSCIINQIKDIIYADYYIGNIQNGNISLDKNHILYYIISSGLNKFDNVFYSNNIQTDFKELFNIDINQELCKCIIIVKLDKINWMAFCKKGTKRTIKWAGKNTLTVTKEGITYPRKDFNFISQDIIHADPFRLTNNNMTYLRQLLVFFLDRMNGVNIFNEYFMNHDKDKQMMLFSNITHEIRNPLNAIIGLFDLLKIDKSDINTMVDDGIMISNQLLELISNLINATKYQYNSNVSLDVINWKVIIDKCIKTYRYILNPNVKFYSIIDPNLPLLFGDIIKIQQILSNLISNSVKFTKNGKIVIEIIIINKIDDTYWVKIKITDTGIGIPKDKQLRLFQTFEQANTDFIHSSGIGLSVCLQLTTLLNGSITFESEENIGTVFNINLPLIYKPHVKEVKFDTTAENTISSEPFESKKLTILVTEDNTINQKILSKKLEYKGHKVFCANDGHQTLKLVTSKKFDLILMDLQLTNDLDGLQTTAILRNKHNFKNPIIAVTGNSFEQSFYKKNGFDDFILKPINYYKLDKIIYNIQSEK